MKKSTAIFVSGIFFLALFIGACTTQGRIHDAEYADPSGTVTIKREEVRGMPSTKIRVKSKYPGAAVGQAGVPGYGYGSYGDPYGGYSGSAHTDVPDGRSVTCVVMKTGPYAGQRFCPSQSGGPVPMVRNSVESGEGGQNPYHQQVPINAAEIQRNRDAINCLQKKTCRRSR